MKMSIFFLTCQDKKEAGKITQALLDKRLVVCSKSFPVSSNFLWKGSKDRASEVLVIYESVEENFSKVEQEIKKLHSYTTPVFFSLPVGQTTKGVKDWIKKEIK